MTIWQGNPLGHFVLHTLKNHTAESLQIKNFSEQRKHITAVRQIWFNSMPKLFYIPTGHRKDGKVCACL